MGKRPPHTFRHSCAPSLVPPLAASLILWFIVAFFYWRPPNAWAPSPSLFSRCVAFRHPKQPPQRELNYIAHARRRARCYELARRAGSGGGKRRGRNRRQRAMGGWVLYFFFKMLPLWSPLHMVFSGPNFFGFFSASLDKQHCNFSHFSL